MDLLVIKNWKLYVHRVGDWLDRRRTWAEEGEASKVGVGESLGLEEVCGGEDVVNGS